MEIPEVKITDFEKSEEEEEEEESFQKKKQESFFSKKIYLKIILLSILFFWIPLCLLIVYAFFLVSFVSLIYIIIAFVLFILHYEKKYIVSEEKYEALMVDYSLNQSERQTVDISVFSKKWLAFLFSLIFGVMCIIMKLTFLVLILKKKTFSKNLLTILDIYFDENFDVNDILNTFLPQIILTILNTVSFFYYKHKDVKKREILLKNILIRRYHFQLLRLLMFLCFALIPAFNFSIIGMYFICVLLIYSSMRMFFRRRYELGSKNSFYRIIRFFIILIILANYIILILLRFEINNEILKFVGIDGFEDLFQEWEKYINLILMIFLFIILSVYCDCKKKYSLKINYEPIDKPRSESNIYNYFQQKRETDDSKKEGFLLKSKIEKSKKALKDFWYYLKKVFADLIGFFYSSTFVIKVVQIATIVFVMRYFTYFSIPMILALYMTIFINKSKVLIWILLSMVVLPTVSVLFLIYYTNITTNPYIPPFKNSELVGFVLFEYKILEYILITFYLSLVLILIYLLITKSQKEKFPHLKIGTIQEMSYSYDISGFTVITKEKITLSKILIAVLFRYSLILTLLILFWISFYRVNLIHFVLALFFFVFLGKMNKRIQINQTDSTKEIFFIEKYWIFLVIYVEIVIFGKYIWSLCIKPYISVDSEWLNFIGIEYQYPFVVSIGFISKDYGSLTVFWLLFIFVAIQHNAYQSEIFRNYSKNIVEVIQNYSFMNKYFPGFTKTINSITSFYYMVILWLSYLIITNILIFIDSNLVNFVLLIFSLISLMIFAATLRNQSKNMNSIQLKCWNVIVIATNIIILIKYFFQFFQFSFIENLIKNNEIYQFFIKRQKITGIYFYKEDSKSSTSLRSDLFPFIVIMFFCVLTIRYLRILVIYANVFATVKKQKTDIFRKFSYESKSPDTVSKEFASRRIKKFTSYVPKEMQEEEISDKPEKSLEKPLLAEKYKNIELEKEDKINEILDKRKEKK